MPLDERVPALLDGLPLRMSPERIFDAGQFPAGGAGMAGTAGDLLTNTSFEGMSGRLAADVLAAATRL